MRKNRLETLSDGIFAIVITLLALDIHLPAGFEVKNEWDLLAILYMLLPNMAAYVLSFLTIGIFWNVHHTFFTFIRIIDRRVLWMNIFYMLLIAFIPFPTSLLAQNPGMTTSIVLYSLVLVIASVWQLSMLRYVHRKNHLSEEWYEHTHMRHAMRIGLVGPVLYLLSMGLAFVHTHISFIVLLCVPVYYIFIANSEKHLPQE